MSNPKPQEIRKKLQICIKAMPVKGYLIMADIGIFGFYTNIAAVTTKQEAETIITDLIDNRLQ